HHGIAEYGEVDELRQVLVGHIVCARQAAHRLRPTTAKTSAPSSELQPPSRKAHRWSSEPRRPSYLLGRSDPELQRPSSELQRPSKLPGTWSRKPGLPSNVARWLSSEPHSPRKLRRRWSHKTRRQSPKLQRRALIPTACFIAALVA